tara:strand:+ start:697 stop:828 length:132 start_codon:yes stop_codon:yes gene_type:complete
MSKIIKYWSNHHVSATDWEKQEELTQILDKLVGDISTPVTGDD